MCLKEKRFRNGNSARFHDDTKLHRSIDPKCTYRLHVLPRNKFTRPSRFYDPVVRSATCVVPVIIRYIYIVKWDYLSISHKLREETKRSS